MRTFLAVLSITILFSSCYMEHLEWYSSSSVEESKENGLFIASYYPDTFLITIDSLQYRFAGPWLEHNHVEEGGWFRIKKYTSKQGYLNLINIDQYEYKYSNINDTLALISAIAFEKYDNKSYRRRPRLCCGDVIDFQLMKYPQDSFIVYFYNDHTNTVIDSVMFFKK